MSKTYILQKDLPDGSKIGDRYIKGEYRYYNERIHAEAKGIIESVNWETWQVENNPEWFLPEEKNEVGGGLIGVSIKGNVLNYTNSASIKLGKDDKVTAIAMDGKIFLPENKSNDSFQWNDSLVKDFVAHTILGHFDNSKECLEVFKQSHTPKPQAENKPDWEIVAFKMEDGQIIERQAKPNYDFCFFIKEGHKRGWIHESTCIEKYPIHSVKRLSDGEVFSVGDEALVKYEDGQFKINGWYINDSIKQEMMASFIATERKGLIAASIDNLSKLPPQPQKLFTTEDGKDIFEGDDWWVVHTHTNWSMHMVDASSGHIVNPNYKGRRFSTPQAAEKYIADNKPQPQKEEQRFGDRPVFTPRDYEEYGRKCFEAGRDRIGGWWNDPIKNYKYTSYEHYKTSSQDYKNSKQ